MPNTLSRSHFSRLSLLLIAIVLAATTNAPSQTINSANNATSNATPSGASGEIRITPEPKQLKSVDAVFRINRNTAIALADPRSEDDRFAAEDFVNDVSETAGVTLMINKGRKQHSILIGLTHLTTIDAALRRAGLSAPANLNDEGYVLSVTANEVVVAGQTAAGVFYGLQTLKQLVRGEGANAFIQGVQVTDWPTMRWRAVSDDISRGPVPTVAYIKRQLKTFAAFKLNMHSFYMEHTFASVTHPLIGPPGGSLSPAEIRELVDYARKYHIEIVPEQQTFGHLHKALKLEKYNELAELPYGDVLSPQQAGTYKLIADLYGEIGALFPGKFFHIGADETFELGEGQSREAAQARGVGAIYFDHLNRVREILKPYNRRLMFWGDIALRHPELIGQIPRDMIVMNWTYGPRDTYSARIKPFKDAGLEQFVCPGVSNWNQIFPNTEAATINIVNFVRDGQAANALGMMNTSWDDDGESLFEMTWYGVVLGAAAAWQDAPLDTKRFDHNFDWAFFRNDGEQFVKATRDLGRVNALLGTGSSDQLFWQEPFTDAFQERARTLRAKTREMRLMVENVEEILMRDQARARRNASVIPAMLLAARRFDHLGRRMQVMEQFSRDYWNAYLNLGDKRKAQRLRRYTGAIYNSLREMAEESSELRSAYRAQWLAENRPYWLDSVLARYDQATNNWLSKIKKLEEALRDYDATSTLPAPDEFGLGARPTDTAATTTTTTR